MAVKTPKSPPLPHHHTHFLSSCLFIVASRDAKGGHPWVMSEQKRKSYCISSHRTQTPSIRPAHKHISHPGARPCHSEEKHPSTDVNVITQQPSLCHRRVTGAALLRVQRRPAGPAGRLPPQLVGSVGRLRAHTGASEELRAGAVAAGRRRLRQPAHRSRR